MHRLDRPVFAVGDAVYTWRDVVDAAVAWSDWGQIEQRTREGIACRRRLDEEPGALAQADVERAARAFRYRRRLLSAEDARAWLASWGLTVGDWYEYLRRSLLRTRWSDIMPAADANGEVRALAEVEAICSGELERLAEKLAGRAAAHVAGGAGPARVEPSELEASFARFRAARATPEAVERELEAHLLDWVRFDVEELVIPGEATAREVLLSLRDGRSAEEVARDAGVGLRRASVLLGEAEPVLASALVSAAEGDVVGPLAREGAFAVARVRARISPSPSDAAILGRAEEAALERAVRREVTNRVRWHDRH